MQAEASQTAVNQRGTATGRCDEQHNAPIPLFWINTLATGSTFAPQSALGYEKATEIAWESHYCQQRTRTE